MMRKHQTMTAGNRTFRTLSTVCAAATFCIATIGCGTGVVSESGSPKSPISVALTGLGGVVMGGEQPIVGASLQIYVANLSGGYDSTAAPLMTTPVYTQTNGTFKIPASDIQCSSPSSDYLLLTATSGVSGSNVGANANIVNMIALGPCSGLGQYQHITINELTTIAAAYALQGFMSGFTTTVTGVVTTNTSNVTTGPTVTQTAYLGTTSTNTIGLLNAFNAASLVVNPYYGQLPGLLPAGATENQAEINTLADILVSCVNSASASTGSGSSTSYTPSSPCNSLFSYTENSGNTTADTATAAIAMAQNPGRNVTNLIAQSGSYQPFTPTLTSANDFTIAIRYTASSINAPVGIAADQSGNIWIANTGTGTNANVTKLTAPSVASSTFVPPATTAYASGSTGNGAIAIDLNGNAWTPSSAAGSIVEISTAGSATTYSDPGLGTINSIAVDGSGYVWASGSNNTVNAVSSSNGTSLSSTGFTGGGISDALSVAITPH